MQEGLKGALKGVSFPDSAGHAISRSCHSQRVVPLSLLAGLMSRITAVKQDCAKAEADNDMLQMYIDSVTKSLAAKS